MDRFREDLRTTVICLIVVATASVTPAIAHGVQHALFAHNAGKLGGKPASAYGPSSGVNYSRVVVVAKKGGDFKSVQPALDSIQGTQANPALVWVAPGTYQGRVRMEPFVDIEGAGRRLTRLIASSASMKFKSYVVKGSDSASLRQLTVQNNGGGATSIGVFNQASSPSLTDLLIIANDGGTTSAAIYNRENLASPGITDVQASASGPSLAMGMYNNGGSTTVDTSSFVGGDPTNSAVAVGIRNTGFLTAFDTNVVAFQGSVVMGLQTGSGADPGAAKLVDSRMGARFGENRNRAASVDVAGSVLDVRHSAFRTFGGDTDPAALQVDTGAKAQVATSEIDGAPAVAGGGVYDCRLMYSFSGGVLNGCFET